MGSIVSASATKAVKHAAYLISETPLIVLPTLAVMLGINKAIAFQQLHYLLNGQKESKNTYAYFEDRWWVYNSYPEWQKVYFPWLSLSAIKGIFRDLEAESIVISRQSVKHKSDRRKWYTIDYEAWDKICLIIRQKMSDQPSDKKCLMVGQKMSDGYSNTSSKKKTTSSPALAKSDAPKPQRKHDVIFDTLGTSIFEIDLNDKAQVQGHSGRIVALKKKLKAMYPETLEEILAEKINAFPAWYHAQPETKGASLPLGTDTFSGHFSKFMASIVPLKLSEPNPNCPLCKGKGHYDDPTDRNTVIQCDCRHNAAARKDVAA